MSRVGYRHIHPLNETTAIRSVEGSLTLRHDKADNTGRWTSPQVDAPCTIVEMTHPSRPSVGNVSGETAQATSSFLSSKREQSVSCRRRLRFHTCHGHIQCAIIV